MKLFLSDDRAELGYWIGKPYWGKGYATEVAERVLRYAFEARALNRVHACFFASNPASGNVLRKIGMVHEGRFRRHIKKWGRYEDVDQYAIMREDYER